MRIILAGHKARGDLCLRALVRAGYSVVAVLAHPPTDTAQDRNVVAQAARDLNLSLLRPVDVNADGMVATLREFAADIIILAGYSQIFKPPLFDLPRWGCINLHAGKLPEYRGSSPLNWALINGESSFTLSVVRVDKGVDTGDVLAERTFPIGTDETIVDLHQMANQVFPEMVLELIPQIKAGSLKARPQDESKARYFPLRFPDDGLILWDIYTAEQVHNRIRALTYPYPGAFTFSQGKRVILLRSKLTKQLRRGEPGRVYLRNSHGLLVCASDHCLWIQEAVDEQGTDVLERIKRYDTLATLREAAVSAWSPPWQARGSSMTSILPAPNVKHFLYMEAPRP